jgi:hypothetical protein
VKNFGECPGPYGINVRELSAIQPADGRYLNTAPGHDPPRSGCRYRQGEGRAYAKSFVKG